MTPEILAPGIDLYEGDSFAILPTLADASKDIVLSDPPYGETTHKGARTGRGDTVLVDFDSIDDDQFLFLARHSVRIARRWVLMTCEWRHAVVAEKAMPESFVRCGVWIKPDAAPQFTGDRPGTGWEAILLLHRPGRKRWNGGGHHAVWTCPVERNNTHRTQKPLKLTREWIRLFTEPGESILDPFAGHGTTATAALLEGRDCTMIEKDAGHCQAIRDRIRHADGRAPGTLTAMHQMGMFDLELEAA